MCGISGFVRYGDFDGNLFLDEALSATHNRGPDSCGRLVREHWGLGHTRLSIVDLSELGHQPMVHREARLAISFNGEIYNFRDLRQELEQLGSTFCSRSDTEVILEAYRQWGLDFVSRLDGMFAFGLLDWDQRRLVLARDPLGKKPLYYYQDGDCFLFCSDIRPIWKARRDRLTLDPLTLDYYLSELSSPQPHTIWSEIRQIDAGNSLVLSLETGLSEGGRFWKLPLVEPGQMDLNEAVEYLDIALCRAVKSRLECDVPVACFLSGGVDSAIVAATYARLRPNECNTFTAGIEGLPDERPEARAMAERIGSLHTEVIVHAEARDDVVNLIKVLGEPFADSSVLPTFYVCRAMRERFKVALSGDGGDELFGGYQEYLAAYRAHCFEERVPSPNGRRVIAGIDKVLSRFQGGRPNLGSQEHYLRLSGPERLSRDMGFSSNDKSRLYDPVYQSRLQESSDSLLHQVWIQNQGFTPPDSVMRSSLKTRLLNDYLVKVDRASMQCGLEVRSPLLDRNLLEWALQLPLELKFHGNSGKFVLKELLKKSTGFSHTLPKQGFSIPLSRWLRSEFAELVQQCLTDSSPLLRSGIFQSSYLKSLWSRHLQGHEDHTNRIWLMVCLNLWMGEFFQ